MTVRVDPAGLDGIWSALLDAVRPERSLTVSEWAEAHRVLDGKTSGEQGPWRNSRMPHAVEIMDALSPSHPCRIVVFIKSTQIAGTEIMNNWIGHTIDVSPSPMLIVQPTIALVERYSRQRLDSMFDTTPRLAGKIREAKSRDGANTVKMKEFDGGMLILSGANSPSSLQSMPAMRAAMDEVDDYPFVVGAGDGDISPIASVLERQQNFPRRKTFITSTPLDKGRSHVEEWFEKSNKKRRWVPCPLDGCGKFQVLRWSQVKWPKDDPGRAWYECEHCGGAIQNRQKAWMLPRGEWRAERETDGEIEGFHISGLYRPVGMRTWGYMARMFVEAGRDPIKLKAFFNKQMGESWDESATMRPDPTGLAVRTEAYGVHLAESDDAAVAIPGQVVVLTLGVDVQADRIEAQLVGYGRGQQSWVCGYWVLRGDVTAPDVWADLDELRTREFVNEHGVVMAIQATAVDTGFEAMRVYAYVRERQRVYAVKGDADDVGPARDIWPRKPSRTNKGKVDLYVIGVDSAKSGIYGRLKLTEPGPGYVHFCHGLPDDYFDQLTIEYRKTVKNSRGYERKQWHKPAGARNEALDTAVYALAALHAWLARGYRLESKRVDARKVVPHTGKAADPIAAPVAERIKPARPVRRGGGARGFAGRGSGDGGW